MPAAPACLGRFQSAGARGKGKVGIWQETYVVPAGAHEAICMNMPAYGLAKATGLVPVGRRGDRAADRLRAS
ncbi:hypothetical protein SY2F82_64180 [Streptomyces sp. Y2F8-2]|nr:hypothetical protein SY2F82_64180 [Streptomyces sp. Y2F8-2]